MDTERRLRAVAPRARLMVPESAAVLKRLYFLLRETILMQAGWIPGVSHWETKLLLPELLWEDSTTLRLLRERVLELRYPERRMVEGDDRVLLAAWRAWAGAPSGESYVAGPLRAGKRLLARMARGYLQVADALNDGPTVRILGLLTADLERHEKRLAAIQTPTAVEAEIVWLRMATDTLDGFDALSLLEPTAPSLPLPPSTLSVPFAIDRRGARDQRFSVQTFAWPDRVDHTRPPGAGLELQLRVAVHHLNEIWAAEMAAAVIHDLAPAAPADFLEEAARWCYDETRHCRMGHARLKAWGFADTELPLDRFSYAATAETDPLVRLGTIYYFETTYIHTKSERTRIFTREGDRLSAHDMDFDWADELIHTHYGSKWLGFFLNAQSDRRTPEMVKTEAMTAVRKLQSEATIEERRATEAVRDRLMTRALALAEAGS